MRADENRHLFLTVTFVFIVTTDLKSQLLSSACLYLKYLTPTQHLSLACLYLKYLTPTQHV